MVSLFIHHFADLMQKQLKVPVSVDSICSVEHQFRESVLVALLNIQQDKRFKTMPVQYSDSDLYKNSNTKRYILSLLVFPEFSQYSDNLDVWEKLISFCEENPRLTKAHFSDWNEINDEFFCIIKIKESSLDEKLNLSAQFGEKVLLSFTLEVENILSEL